MSEYQYQNLYETTKLANKKLREQNKELRAENKQLQSLINCVIISCGWLHHSRKDEHDFFEKCPVEKRLTEYFESQRKKK